MNAYRAHAAFACAAFVVATIAGLAYGAHEGSFFLAVPVLTLVAIAWGVLWATADKEAPGPRIDQRIMAARVSGTIGLIVAAVLVVATAF